MTTRYQTNGCLDDGPSAGDRRPPAEIKLVSCVPLLMWICVFSAMCWYCDAETLLGSSYVVSAVFAVSYWAAVLTASGWFGSDHRHARMTPDQLLDQRVMC